MADCRALTASFTPPGWGRTARLGLRRVAAKSLGAPRRGCRFWVGQMKGLLRYGVHPHLCSHLVGWVSAQRVTQQRQATWPLGYARIDTQSLPSLDGRANPTYAKRPVPAIWLASVLLALAAPPPPTPRAISTASSSASTIISAPPTISRARSTMRRISPARSEPPRRRRSSSSSIRPAPSSTSSARS